MFTALWSEVCNLLICAWTMTLLEVIVQTLLLMV